MQRIFITEMDRREDELLRTAVNKKMGHDRSPGSAPRVLRLNYC
jgi:hypothetical protein